MRVNISIPDASVWGMHIETSIDSRTKPHPQSALVIYGARLFSLEHANPPKNAERKRDTYPIGSTSANGSGREMAMAVPSRSIARAIPTVMASPMSEELKSLSIVVWLFVEVDFVRMCFVFLFFIFPPRVFVKYIPIWVKI